MGTPPARRQVHEGAGAYLPKKPDATLPQLRRAAAKCQGCDLYKNATQVVFGEGAADGAGGGVMFIGEKPGDQEDVQGRPFVGPAGKLLDRALVEAGIDRARVYVTNAVKHFKWTPAPRGKRRLHSKPTAGQVRACRPWLEREIALVKPDVIVCLGATAAQTILGPSFRVTAMRGREIVPEPGPSDITNGARVVATVHPSAILRAPESEDRAREYKAFVADLRVVAKAASK